MMLSVVMPAYNEEAAIEGVVREHVAALGKLAAAIPDWEIVVVDDGSKDRTAAVLERLAVEISRLRVVRQENQGIFGAFTRAYREARGTHVYSTGSDGQWPAENIGPMWQKLEAGYGLVVGVRQNRREVYTPARRVISKMFNLLPRLLFGAPVEDAGSVKLGVRRAFELPLISRSVFFEAERIILAHRTGLRVGFVPIEFLQRKGGKAMGASWKNLRNSSIDLLRCMFKYGFR
jgi:glycosyltransferase involved in cell wall biosynthesis